MTKQNKNRELILKFLAIGMVLFGPLSIYLVRNDPSFLTNFVNLESATRLHSILLTITNLFFVLFSSILLFLLLYRYFKNGFISIDFFKKPIIKKIYPLIVFLFFSYFTIDISFQLVNKFFELERLVFYGLSFLILGISCLILYIVSKNKS